jgi:ABC-type transport system substrate-binding protein
MSEHDSKHMLKRETIYHRRKLHAFYARWSTLSLLALLLSSVMPPQAAAADMSKTLRVLAKKSETGLDPATASDVNTLAIIENIFDPLLRYDYLARPVQLKPNTLTAMPEVDRLGTTYTFHIRPGIYFTSDPAFKGKPRELTADDYIYSFKRLYDPAIKSPWLFVFEGKIAGDDVLQRPADSGKHSVDIPIEGLSALDRYTLRIRLKHPDHNFLFDLAMPATSALAREVLDAHPREPGEHPVGTGPYLLKEWLRGEKIVLDASPGFRETLFEDQPGDNPADQAIAAALHGKRLPLIGRIDIKIVEEQQADMLSFLSRQFDYLEQIPPPLSGMVLSGGKLRPEIAQQAIQLSLFVPLQTYYMWMNMEDPVLGGYTPDKIALRRAIALAYNREEDIRVLERGLGLPAQSPLPPDALGYDPNYRSTSTYDPQLARALLDRFGYRDINHDGYREMPDGKPLTLTMHTQASTTGRLRDELWQRSLDAIGIRVVFKSDKYTEIIKQSRLGKVQMFETDWIADIPDGENFLQLLYGPNRNGVNYARFNLPEYNRLFEEARALPDSPARTALYRQMAQLIDGYAPWVVRIHPISADLRYAWVKNYKRHPVAFTNWRYLDIDKSAQR